MIRFLLTLLLGRDIDFDKATTAAARGDAQAQYDLSIIYTTGKKVPRDYGRAMKLLTASAESGYPGAQYALGNAFYLGHMAQRKDYVRAYAWFNVYIVCTPRLRGMGQDQREDVEKLMTPEEVAEAQNLSKAFLAKIETAKYRWRDSSS
jgi:hypothetical protein